MEKSDAREFLRTVLSKNDEKQLQAALRKGKDGGFHHGGWWFGPGENDTDGTALSTQCVLASIFKLKPDPSGKGWWGAKIDKNAFAAYEFLLRAAGGDAGADRFVEATMALTDAELVSLIDEIAQGKKKRNGRAKKAS